VSFYYAAGQYMNLLERALSITPTPSADSLFPATALYDSRPSRVMRHGSNAANPEVRWDLAAFTPGGSGGSPYYYYGRAGERRVVTLVGTANVTVQNMLTLKYLTSGGAWQVASANCLTAAGSLNYQIESMETCQQPTVQMKVTTSGGTSVADWPRWNACVVFGHNIDTGLL
jgi:hypothetical protein